MGTPVTDYNTATEVFLASFHSINVPSEWGLAPVAPAPVATLPVESFHSINVPSEWGHGFLLFWEGNMTVSIQLMSPASGDFNGS